MRQLDMTLYYIPHLLLSLVYSSFSSGQAVCVHFGRVALEGEVKWEGGIFLLDTFKIQPTFAGFSKITHSSFIMLQNSSIHFYLV